MTTITTPSGLQYEEIAIGTGPIAQAGHTVSVHYSGCLADGSEFDSSRYGDQPIEFNLGMGEVIRGWDEGIQGMQVGGMRKLTIPAVLGYGERGAGNAIPPGATLIFEVELMGIYP